ncbi:pyruvate, water dikinase [Promicromonospora umidemergens]|uniref:Pyruvate,water dikinase n=1 Tax=Promicromonospora umidemergens TaxID=629679 RepID=A0ABP8XTH1_9MICO|nr:PEP/pyruvate-binding domain-containing protein [Promicromonospora umidemergens]MCP2285329.1 pyruvate, water dikinase [Promicromonospora umidemergens]
MTSEIDQPFVLDLADPAAVQLELTGGKGSSLARLAAAGLPVPGGFHVTTGAYRAAVVGAPQRAIIDAMGTVAPDRPETHEAAAARIAEVFAALEVPAAVADAVRAGYSRLRTAGDPADSPVAVRSSATAEDLPGMSFAGQQDSFLNIRGADALLCAVRDCWGSLWTARAIGYRARHGIPASDVTLAVVVQHLVDADAAGILFTVDPMTGSRDRVLINAAWGLGEAVVGGQVTPDTYLVARVGGAVDAGVSTKEVRTVRTADGTRNEPVPTELRDRPALTEEQAARLATLGTRIEELYAVAMDVEWALRDGSPFILQARPVTGAAGRRAVTEVWNDSLRGDYLWTNANLGEALPSVMTPLTWSLVQIFMANAMASAELGHPVYGTIGGRFYMNLSVTETVGRALGMTEMSDAAQREVFGQLPGHVDIPVIPIGRWALIKMLVPAVRANQKALAADLRALPGYLATAEGRGTELRERVARIDDVGELAAFWREELAPYLVESSRMLRGAGKQDGNALLRLRRDLREKLGDADAEALTSGLSAGGQGLASMGPLVGLREVARGNIDRETYVRRYGHRSADEFEVSEPRPAEQPGWLDRQLAGLTATDVDTLLARQAEVRAAAWARLDERSPRKAAALRRRLARWSRTARDRESARSEVVRTFWALRTFALRAGELTGLGDDVIYLDSDELVGVLDGAEVPRGRIAIRRATYEQYRDLPAYPAVIRGRFDPVWWASDPARRTDVFDEHGLAVEAGDEVRGFPGAAGVVEGVARVVGTVDDGDALRPGEVLVTSVTNVGWTPLFPRAAAVVTDVGAPLSHAAIVARELGIPAVVGCGNATMRLRTGDLLRVDGAHGTVEILEPAGAGNG